MSRRYAITKVVARYRVRLVRNPDPTAERGSGNRKVPRFIHDPTDGKQSQWCPSNVAFGKPLPLGAMQNRCPSGQRCPSNVASGKPLGQRKTVAPRGNGVPRMMPPENRFPLGKRKTVAPRGNAKPLPLEATVSLECRLRKTVSPRGNAKPLPLGATLNRCPSGATSSLSRSRVRPK